MIRLVAIGGLPGSGKTDLLISVLNEFGDTSRIGVLVNNIVSLDQIKASFPKIKCMNFPLTAPCGRARQFSGTLEKFVSNNEVDLIITEPSGPCTETVAPLLNPIMAFHKDRIRLGPLFTTVNAKMIPPEGLSSSTADGLRLRQQIDESDVVVMSSEGSYGEGERCARTVKEINPDCMVIFPSGHNGVRKIKEIITSDAEYTRPLKN